MKTELDKFRTRWLRWLGQKTRRDKYVWAELLASNWVGWVTNVLSRSGFEVDWLLLKNQNYETVKNYWDIAIREATMEDLRRLDLLFANDLVERQNRSKRRKR